jgi:hypothetical protein
MINPDGYKYMVDEDLISPWWRKNLCDNNDNGTFEPDYDGVDLNRNYDSNWDGGDAYPGSWTYRGEAPFSEAETQLKRDFVLEQKPVMSITYHTYGEIVLAPNIIGYTYVPDRYLLSNIAGEIASRIPKIWGTGNYNPGNCNCQLGQSPCWTYRIGGALEILIEEATVFLPPGPEAEQIAIDNLDGALYLPERVFGPGVCGHVTCMESGEPIQATYKVLDIYDPIITPRTTDSIHGRYHRLLLPGTYTFEFSKEDYETTIVEDVVVGEDTLTVLDVQLTPVGMSVDDPGHMGPVSDLMVFPNPTVGIYNLQFTVYDLQSFQVQLFDLYGREAANLLDRQLKEGEHHLEYDISDLAPGVYFLVIKAGMKSQKVKIIKL